MEFIHENPLLLQVRMTEQSNIPFLQLVAQDLTDRFGTDLSRVTVVFPSRRARLFFNNYLYRSVGEPVWAPQYLTIDELFGRKCNLRIADNIKLVAELYDVYLEIYNKEATSPSQETLDEFYFFGEILLGDFDDIDKNMANALSLFSNLQDLDALRDDFTHLSEAQIESISRYFNSHFQGGTRLQEAFQSIWNILGKVYFAFKQRLLSSGIAYPGMMMRSVIEEQLFDLPDNSRSAAFPNAVEETSIQYVFAGFNVLNGCEKALFKQLKKISLFYWDYDSYYLDMKGSYKHEAGRFIKENIQQFGSALNPENFSHSNFPEKEITIISAPSESAQTAYISPWTESLQNTRFIDPDSAVVLCNEQILPTVMHAIPPEKVENVNITMGFPITQAPVCSFLQVLTEMQVNGFSASGKNLRYKYVLPVLRHPYTLSVFPEAKETEERIIRENIFFPTPEILGNSFLFERAKDTKQLADYLLEATRRAGLLFKDPEKYNDLYGGLYQESLFRAYQVINRIAGLVSSGELQVEKVTFLRLLKKLFSVTTVPFHGEPVKGLQVMGVLETRTLDFKNLLILSVNEGFMPGTSNDNSFIPQFLRKYFGLSTTEHQDSIFAYYFFRLIQRAENITLIYNIGKTPLGKAEMSRFILQLLVDSRLRIKRFGLSSSVRPVRPETIEVPKNENLIRKIRQQYDRNTDPEAHRLSPSALNVLIDCSLRFYLQYIEGIRTKEELSDELDSSVFGTIFHRAAELLYREIGHMENEKNFTPFIVQKEHYDAYLGKNSFKLDRLISRAFEEKYFFKPDVDISQYNGEQLINFRVIRHLLRRLVVFDRQQVPFSICGLEYPAYTGFELPHRNVSLKIGGIIDRLEEKNGTIRIVDYKTSGSGKSYKEISELFEQKDDRASHIFQTFLYASVLIRSGKKLPVVPTLLYLQEAGKEDYSPVICYEKEEITDFNQLYDIFEGFFIAKLDELFNPEIPFRQTTALKNCAYCDFKELCNR